MGMRLCATDTVLPLILCLSLAVHFSPPQPRAPGEYVETARTKNGCLGVVSLARTLSRLPLKTRADLTTLRKLCRS